MTSIDRPGLPSFLIKEFYWRAERANGSYNLGGAIAETMTVGELLSLEPGAVDRLAAEPLDYASPGRLSPLRRHIKALYEDVAADEIIVVPATEDAISLSMAAALRAGDHVIVQAPAYQSLYAHARRIGCEVDFWGASEAEDWSFDVERLRSLFKPSTRAVILNVPHNPTGAVIPADGFAEIFALAARQGAYVLVDEIYRGLTLGRPQPPAAADVSSIGISIGGTSKTYGMGGLRIGWIGVKDRSIKEKILQLQNYQSLFLARPSEVLGEIAIRNTGRIHQRNDEIVRANLATAKDFFDQRRQTFSWIPPRGGSISFPRLLTGESTTSWSARLYRDTGLLVPPSETFEAGSAHFRLGLGRRDFPKMIEMLADWLADPRGC